MPKGNHLIWCSQPAMPWASTRFLCPDADPRAMNPKLFCHADHYPPPDHPSNSSTAQSHPQQPLRPSNNRCRRWSLPLLSPPPSSSRFESTIFWYSPELFFDTRTDSTFSGYSPGFYDFSVLTLIRPFSDTHPDYFSILARILPFPSTLSDSTIFWYSH